MTTHHQLVSISRIHRAIIPPHQNSVMACTDIALFIFTGDPNGMNPKFRSTFLTLSTLWVQKINTLQVWQGEIVMSEYDTTQKHTSAVQCFGYNVLILGWTKRVVLERSLRHCFLSPAPRVAVCRRHKWRSFVQRISLELDRDKDSIKLRGPPPPPQPHLGALSIYLLKVPVVLFESDSDEHGLTTPAIQIIQCFVPSRSVKSVEIYSACHISKNNLRTPY